MRTTRLRFSVALLCAVIAAVASGGRSPLRAAPADFTRYHSYEELAAALKAAVTAHPDLATLVSIGKTREGRDIWAVEIAKPSGTPVDSRPGLLVAANFEGDHLIGSELALYAVDFLLNGYAADPEVKQRLERSVVYIVPRVNVDGAEQMFAPVKALRRTNTTPVDADNDGRTDED
ncbi:MAG: M14 family zinc carboxypeptidase, partial [Rhodospirillaceae bacterium]